MARTRGAPVRTVSTHAPRARLAFLAARSLPATGGVCKPNPQGSDSDDEAGAVGGAVGNAGAVVKAVGNAGAVVKAVGKAGADAVVEAGAEAGAENVFAEYKKSVLKQAHDAQYERNRAQKVADGETKVLAFLEERNVPKNTRGS